MPAELSPLSQKMLKAIEESSVSAVSAEQEGEFQPILEQAALVGHFDLAWIDALVDPQAQIAARSSVIAISDRVTQRPGVWRLRASERRDLLASLLDDQTRLHKRLRAIRPPEDDRAGQIFRASLQGEDARIEDFDSGTLPSLLDAASWVEHGDVHLPNARDVRREMSRRTLIAGFADLSRFFFGREDEIGRLEDFAQMPVSGSIPVLSIEGIGGIGKSALLARFLHEHLMGEADPDLFIIYIDFDRIGLNPRDTVNLNFEVTRQMAIAFPHLAPQFDRIRREARESHRETTRRIGDGAKFAQSSSKMSSSDANAALEAVIITRSEVMREIGHVLREEALSDKHMMFVFDTFEELQAQSDSALENLATWLSSVQTEIGLETIKVIASGRGDIVFPETPNAEVSGVSDERRGFEMLEPVKLDQLDKGPAIDILAEFGIGEDLADRIYDDFGGNPLILRLIGRMSQQRGLFSLEEFSSDQELRDEVDAEVVQGMIYQRILGHIRDDGVRELAHPGLVLRRVTPELLREVVAPNTPGFTLAPGDEHELFRRLAQEVWLVVRSGEPDTVLHRPDVRKITMALLRKDKDLKTQTEAIHRAATDYYSAEERRDDPLARKELLYHTLMTADPDLIASYTKAQAQEAQTALGANIDELAPENRVALRGALGQGVSDEEARNLPDDLWRGYVERRGDELVTRGDYQQALDLAAERPGLVDDTVQWHWRLLAFDGLARWDEEVEMILYSHGTGATESFWQDFLDSSNDYIYEEGPAGLELSLAEALLKAGQLERASHLAGLVAGLQPEREWAEDREKMAMLLRGAELQFRAERAMTGTGHCSYPDLKLRTSDFLASDELALAHLRLLQVTDAAGSHPFRPTNASFYPSAIWIEDLFQEAQGGTADRLGKLFAELQRTAPARLTTSRLLGHFATEFARIFADAFVKSEISVALAGKIAMVEEYAEFRPAIRGAMTRLFESHPELLHSALDRLSGLLPIIPYDLRPDSLSPRRAGPDAQKQIIVPLIAYADRCGLTSEMIGVLEEFAPEDDAVINIRAAWRRWTGGEPQRQMSLHEETR